MHAVYQHVCCRLHSLKSSATVQSYLFISSNMPKGLVLIQGHAQQTGLHWEWKELEAAPGL